MTRAWRDKIKKFYFFVLDNLQQLEQTKPNTGETNLIGAEGATTPETLRQKDRTHNNSGKKAWPHRRSKSLR